MTRDELAHLLRAACTITGDRNVLVIGSQSILGTFDEADLPPRATASIEADIAFLYDADRSKADDVEGAIGELSAFHQTNGVYAEGPNRSADMRQSGQMRQSVKRFIAPCQRPVLRRTARAIGDARVHNAAGSR